MPDAVKITKVTHVSTKVGDKDYPNMRTQVPICFKEQGYTHIIWYEDGTAKLVRRNHD